MDREIENDDYVFNKLLISVLFDDGYVFDFEKNKLLFTSGILINIKSIIESFCEIDAFNNRVKDNIYYFLNEVRKVNNSPSVIKIINEIIVLLNRCDSNMSNIFYRVELEKRSGNKKFLSKYPDGFIEEQIHLVNISIVHDYLVLKSHSDIVSDEEFKNEWLPEFIESPLYFWSINAIIDEYPAMFKDKTFYNRFSSIIKYSSELENKKINKKYMKKIERKIKKI